MDDAATSVLEAGPYARFIRTKTGHGLGLDIHEAPYIMRGNHLRLEPGMVFTVERGLITETGAESLTSYPRELTLVGTG